MTTAGRDLEEPQADAATSADAAREAREGAAAAEQELAEAQADAGSSTTAPESITTTTGPAVAPASVDRITEAQDDLDAAFEGVDAETTLTAAGEEVNAAAFALEIARLRVLDEAGCLTDEQQMQAVGEIVSYTSALQTSLTTAGFYDGAIDGVYGPGTVDAVKQLQTDNDLPATGFVDPATLAAVQDALSAADEAETTTTTDAEDAGGDTTTTVP